MGNTKRRFRTYRSYARATETSSRSSARAIRKPRTTRTSCSRFPESTKRCCRSSRSCRFSCSRTTSPISKGRTWTNRDISQIQDLFEIVVGPETELHGVFERQAERPRQRIRLDVVHARRSGTPGERRREGETNERG